MHGNEVYRAIMRNPEMLWNADDHRIFLKYCPTAMGRCFHAFARASIGRPSELVEMKISRAKIDRDVGIDIIHITLVNKLKEKRTLTIDNIDCVQYLQEWLSKHPLRKSRFAFLKDAYLFVDNDGKKLSVRQINGLYRKEYQGRLFPFLLKDPSVREKDKDAIRRLLKKPWHPHILRHSGLHELLENHGSLNLRSLRWITGWKTSDDD